MPSARSRGLSTFAAATVAFMVVVILEGAVVRATGSGAGCGQHWPLCNGEVLPHHPRLATIIEFTHRSLTGICSTLVAALTIWTFMARPRGPRACKAALATVLFLITEAALGALLVLGGYVDRNTSNTRVLVQSIHFTNTMLLLAAMSLTWWWNRPPTSAHASLGAPSRAAGVSTPLVATLALLATLITGATGSVAALADTLFPSPSLSAGFAQDFSANAPLLIHMRWMHPAAAVLSLVFVAWLAARLRPSRASRWLFALIALQFLLGITDLALLTPTTLQVLHLLGADLLWIALVATGAEALAHEPAAATHAAPAQEPLVSN